MSWNLQQTKREMGIAQTRHPLIPRPVISSLWKNLSVRNDLRRYIVLNLLHISTAEGRRETLGGNLFVC